MSIKVYKGSEIVEFLKFFCVSTFHLGEGFLTFQQPDKKLLFLRRRYFSYLSPHIPDGESLSCYTFCQLACGMLKAIGDFLNSGIDDVVSRMFVYPDSESSEDEASTRWGRM